LNEPKMLVEDAKRCRFWTGGELELSVSRESGHCNFVSWIVQETTVGHDGSEPPTDTVAVTESWLRPETSTMIFRVASPPIIFPADSDHS